MMLGTRADVSNVEALGVDIQSPSGDWTRFGVMLSQDDSNAFVINQDYWKQRKRPVVGQFFEDKGPTWTPSRTTVSIPHWFGHLLPEGSLRTIIAQRLGIPEVRDFQLLKALGGEDLPGALRTVAVDADGREISRELIEAEENGSGDQLSPYKFSLAGVQLKFSVLSNMRSATLPLRGQIGNAIFKVPDPRSGFAGVPEAEHAAMNLAKLAGIDVAQTQMANVEKVLGTELAELYGRSDGLLIDRFDRLGDSQRVHTEQLAQVLWISAKKQGAKYAQANFETIASLIGGIAGVEVVGEVIDRLVLNLIVGNGDAHLKNWSLVYRDGITATLSPAYDIVPTVAYLANDDFGLKLNGTRTFSEISASSFDRIGELTGYGAGAARGRALNARERVMEHWASMEELVTNQVWKRLEKHRASLSI